MSWFTFLKYYNSVESYSYTTRKTSFLAPIVTSYWLDLFSGEMLCTPEFSKFNHLKSISCGRLDLGCLSIRRMCTYLRFTIRTITNPRGVKTLWLFGHVTKKRLTINPVTLFRSLHQKVCSIKLNYKYFREIIRLLREVSIIPFSKKWELHRKIIYGV